MGRTGASTWNGYRGGRGSRISFSLSYLKLTWNPSSKCVPCHKTYELLNSICQTMHASYSPANVPALLLAAPLTEWPPPGLDIPPGAALPILDIGQQSEQQHCTALHGTALHGTARHCTARHCTARHGTARHCTALHCTALHGTARYCTALLLIALHGTALHYTI